MDQNHEIMRFVVSTVKWLTQGKISLEDENFVQRNILSDKVVLNLEKRSW